MNYRTPRFQFSIFFWDEMYRFTSAGFPTTIFPLYMTPLGLVVCARWGGGPECERCTSRGDPVGLGVDEEWRGDVGDRGLGERAAGLSTT